MPGKSANDDSCLFLRKEGNDPQNPELHSVTAHLGEKRNLSYTRKSKALEYDLQKLNWQGMWQ